MKSHTTLIKTLIKISAVFLIAHSSASSQEPSSTIAKAAASTIQDPLTNALELVIGTKRTDTTNAIIDLLKLGANPLTPSSAGEKSTCLLLYDQNRLPNFMHIFQKNMPVFEKKTAAEVTVETCKALLNDFTDAQFSQLYKPNADSPETIVLLFQFKKLIRNGILGCPCSNKHIKEQFIALHEVLEKYKDRSSGDIHELITFINGEIYRIN